MTDKQHPAQFDWATELSDAQGRVTLSAQEAKEIGARLRSMGEKLKAYEDLGTATQAQATAVPMSHEGAKALVRKYGNDPLHLVLQVERHHGIKGGQHGAE